MFRGITDAGSPVMANQVLAAASAMFSWAIREEVVEPSNNPCIGIGRNPTKPRERVLSDTEVALFWDACNDVDLVRGLAPRMILPTGQRPGEARHMHRDHIEGRWWTMHDKPEPGTGWPGT